MERDAIRKFGARRPDRGDSGSARVATRLLYGSVGKGGATIGRCRPGASVGVHCATCDDMAPAAHLPPLPRQQGPKELHDGPSKEQGEKAACYVGRDEDEAHAASPTSFGVDVLMDCRAAGSGASWLTLALMRRPPEKARRHYAPLTGDRRRNDQAN